MAETERGGRYIVRGRLVDANGKPIQEAKSQESDADDLEDHTVEELRDMAGDQDINLEGATRKADIISRIREASNS